MADNTDHHTLTDFFGPANSRRTKAVCETCGWQSKVYPVNQGWKATAEAKAHREAA